MTPAPVYQVASSKPVPQVQHAHQPQSAHQPPNAHQQISTSQTDISRQFPASKSRPNGSATFVGEHSAVKSTTRNVQNNADPKRSLAGSPRANITGSNDKIADSQSRDNGMVGNNRQQQSQAQPREPPPYDYPHHRKPANQMLAAKSESASALPEVDNATKQQQKLLRQANSDSQLLAPTASSAAAEPTTVTSALDVLKSGVTSSAGSPTTQNTSQTRAPRYASRSVIANTYMNKLSSNALDQYRKNMSLLYGDQQQVTDPAASPSGAPAVTSGRDASMSSPSAAEQSTSSASSRDSPLGSQPYTSLNQPAVKVDRLSNGVTSAGHATATANGAAVPPPYNIEPERAKLRPGAPRPLRRRLSSGGDSPMAVAKAEVRNRSYDEEQTSFSTQADDSSDKRRSPPDSYHSQSDTSPTPITQPEPNQVLDPPDLIRMDVIRKDTEPDTSNDSHNFSELENIPYADDDSVSSKQSSPVKSLTGVQSQLRGGIFLKPGKPKRSVKFNPLALLLDAALEGELELVVKSAHAVSKPARRHVLLPK